MPKHHHQGKTEQIYNRTHGAAPFHYEKMPYQASELMNTKHIQAKMAVDDSSISY